KAGREPGRLDREGADLRLGGDDVSVDALDDAARVQLAAGEPLLLLLEMLEAAEALADLVADVEQRRSPVEVAHNGEVGHQALVMLVSGRAQAARAAALLVRGAPAAARRAWSERRLPRRAGAQSEGATGARGARAAGRGAVGGSTPGARHFCLPPLRRGISRQPPSGGGAPAPRGAAVGGGRAGRIDLRSLRLSCRRAARR